MSLLYQVHMLTVIFEGTFRSAFSIALVVMPPVGMSIVICAVLPQVSQLCGCDDRELHYGWSALLVVLADLVETFCYLWKLLSLRWWKSFTIGILLKFSLLSLCLELVECAFRLKGSGAPLALRRRAKLWLYGHRMAQDLAVSSLIFGLLSIGTFFDCIKAKVCGCKGCGLHNILVYRDPGGVHKRQVIRRAQNAGEFTEAGGEEPPALAPLAATTAYIPPEGHPSPEATSGRGLEFQERVPPPPPPQETEVPPPPPPPPAQ